jgi:hypothetical protein
VTDLPPRELRGTALKILPSSKTNHPNAAIELSIPFASSLSANIYSYISYKRKKRATSSLFYLYTIVPCGPQTQIVCFFSSANSNKRRLISEAVPILATCHCPVYSISLEYSWYTQSRLVRRGLCALTACKLVKGAEVLWLPEPRFTKALHPSTSPPTRAKSHTILGEKIEDAGFLQSTCSTY